MVLCIPNPEGRAYKAAQIIFKKQLFLFRQARQTPKKKGLFATFWHRPAPDQPIAPYAEDIRCWGAVIFYCTGERSGYFFFPKRLLVSRGIFSSTHAEGKRALRLYAPFEQLASKQACRTQIWQAPYFIEHTKKALLSRPLPLPALFKDKMLVDLFHTLCLMEQTKHMKSG